MRYQSVYIHLLLPPLQKLLGFLWGTRGPVALSECVCYNFASKAQGCATKTTSTGASGRASLWLCPRMGQSWGLACINVCVCVHNGGSEWVRVNDHPTGPASHPLHQEAIIDFASSALWPSTHLGQRAGEQTTFCCLPGWCLHHGDSHRGCGNEGSELYPWQCCYPAAPAGALIRLDMIGAAGLPLLLTPYPPYSIFLFFYWSLPISSPPCTSY